MPVKQAVCVHIALKAAHTVRVSQWKHDPKNNNKKKKKNAACISIEPLSLRDVAERQDMTDDPRLQKYEEC